MPRSPNFFYQDPTAEIGNSLVHAILGDPEMAAKQREMQGQVALRDAQRQEAEAHGGLYRSQTTGQNTANTAQTSLPELFHQFGLSNGPAPAPATVDSAGFGDFNAPFTMPVDNRPDHATALGNLIAGMGQMSGDKIDPTKMMGAYGAFTGNEDLQRAGVIAQGNSPSKDFAGTAERADTIALNDAQQKQKQAWGVAEINQRHYIPVANIQRKSAFDVATINNRDDVPVALLNNDAKRYATDVKASGPAPGFDAITNVFPGARMNSGYRSEAHNREVGGVSNSYHLGQAPGTQAYDIDAQPGVTVDQAAAAIEAKNPGVRVIEARDETGRTGPNGKSLGGWHFTLANTGGPKAKAGKAPAPPKPPKPVSAAAMKLIDNELKTYGVNGYDTLDRSVQGYDPVDRIAVRADAAAIYQQTGNSAEAARKAVFNFAAKRRAQQGRSRPGDPGYVAPKATTRAAPTSEGWGRATVVSAPPVPGARKAPDGKWYVQTGTKDGKPTYARVD